MWVEVLAFLFLLAMGCLVPTQLVELGEKVELLKNILTFIGECPKWLDYRNRLDENVKTLDKKMKALCCRRDDVNEVLATAELESRTKRKREVGYWLQNVEILVSEVDRIMQGFEGMNFLKHAWQGSQVEKKIKEVDKLYKEGRFEEGLVLKSLRTSVDALLTKTLLDTQQVDVERIWECVMNDDAFIIGVTGEQGIGKTSIIEHIYNRLIDSNFDCVFVTISEEYSSRKLQSDIAKQIIPSFVDEEDERKRVAMLYKWLRREKSVLILDGLPMHVSLDKIGISTQMNGCKLILTSRSLEVCRRMSCRQTIKVAPLPSDEAEKLFMNEVRLNDHCNPEIKIIAEQIVNECAGLPLSIFNTAERLMGVDDIYEWRTMLNELREHGPIH